MKRNFIAGCLLVFGTSAMAQGVRKETEWDRKLVSIANKEGVPALLLAGICYVESAHRPHATNHDDGGSSSIGLCQIKLTTAQMLGYTGTVEGLYDGKTNAKWAARYIKYQLKRYHNDWEKAAAAYNAGSVFIRKTTNEFVNQTYVDRVMRSIRQ